MANALNITNITPPRVPFLEAGTNWISREWYRWLLNMFARMGSTDGEIAALLSAPYPQVMPGPSLDVGSVAMPFLTPGFDLEPSPSAVLSNVPLGCERIGGVIADGNIDRLVFAGIPSYYTALRLIVTGRDRTTASDFQEATLQINSDTTSTNFTDAQYLKATGATVTGGTIAAVTYGAKVVHLPGAKDNSNATGSTEILLPDYAGDYHKRVQSFASSTYGSAPTTMLAHYACTWKSTAPITKLDVVSASASFVAGTVATLYGYR